VAVYKPLVITGNLAFVSGHGPLRTDLTLITGVVGRDLDLDGGKAAARQVGLAILATLRDQLGSLDRVKRVIKILGMVNSAPDFYEHPKVINGCSELFAEIWGPTSASAAAAPSAWAPPGQHRRRNRSHLRTRLTRRSTPWTASRPTSNRLLTPAQPPVLSSLAPPTPRQRRRHLLIYRSGWRRTSAACWPSPAIPTASVPTSRRTSSPRTRPTPARPRHHPLQVRHHRRGRDDRPGRSSRRPAGLCSRSARRPGASPSLVRTFPRTRFSTVVDADAPARDLGRLAPTGRGAVRTPARSRRRAAPHRDRFPGRPPELALLLRPTRGDFRRVARLRRTSPRQRSGSPPSACRRGRFRSRRRPPRSTSNAEGVAVPRMVVGGTPTFPFHARRTGVECSPGTCVLWDAGYASASCPISISCRPRFS
jgi:enamine deaminase RidA (YjgF/YER057c/UK114 family)